MKILKPCCGQLPEITSHSIRCNICSRCVDTALIWNKVIDLPLLNKGSVFGNFFIFEIKRKGISTLETPIYFYRLSKLKKNGEKPSKCITVYSSLQLNDRTRHLFQNHEYGYRSLYEKHWRDVSTYWETEENLYNILQEYEEITDE